MYCFIVKRWYLRESICKRMISKISFFCVTISEVDFVVEALERVVKNDTFLFHP